MRKMLRIKPWEKLPSSTSSSNRAKDLALGATPQVSRFLGLAMKKAKSKKAWHFNQVKDGRRWMMMSKVDTFMKVLNGMPKVKLLRMTPILTNSSGGPEEL